MKKSVQLKQQRTTILEQQRSIVNKAKAENREFTPEEQADLDAKDQEIERLEGEIEVAERNEKREERFAAASGIGVHEPGQSSENREVQNIAERASIAKVLRGIVSGKGNYTPQGAEKELHEIGMEENRAAGGKAPEDVAFAYPINTINRATQQTVSQDSGEYGGALVQPQTLRTVDGLRPNLFLEELGATFLMGLTGGDLPLITSDAFNMAYYGEVEEIELQKQKFKGKILSPKRTAGAVDISNRLIFQSGVDVESWIQRELVGALGRTIQKAAINGTGTGANPTGLLQMTNINKAAGTAAVVATWERIIALQGLIEESDAGDTTLGYLIHPKVKAALKALKVDTGSGRFIFEKGMIDDLKTVSSSLVPLLTSSTSYPVIFGDWKEMFIGQWGALNIQANPYSADLANSTRFVFNTLSDSNVVNEKAFAVDNWIKGATS